MFKVCVWAEDRTLLKYFDPELWPSTLCLSRSPWLLNRALRVHSLGCWLFLIHRVYVRLQLYCLSSTILACLCSRWTQLPGTQLVGLILPSTPTRWYGHASTTTSDMWGPGCVTSAPFGMACVIVIERKQLSSSSEATLFRCVSQWEYNGIFFTSSHFISQFPPTRFPLITATRLCHLLPVHYLEWHFLPGQQVKT